MPQAVKEKAPGLEGVRGRIRLETNAEAIYILRVEDGHAELIPGGGDADVVLIFPNEIDIPRLLSGELNPIVAALQGHVMVKGDKSLALKVFMGLRAGSPFLERSLP